MKCILLVLGVALAWSLPFEACAQDLDLIRQGVVKVVPKAPGRDPATGFIVRIEARAAYVVTASHVVAGASEIGVEFFSARRLYPARVLGMEGKDPDGLAALIVEGEVPSDAVVLAINRDLDARAGEPITVIGFPRSVGVPWAVTRGSIVGRRGRSIVFSGAAVDPGNSGGPLLKGDQVIGVITLDQEKYAFASPSVIAQYALEGWAVRFGVRLRSTPLVLRESDLLRMIKAKGFNHPAREVRSRDSSYKPLPVEMESVFGHFRHEYEPRIMNGHRVVVDHATGLMWQQSGSELRDEVKPDEFIGDLNRSRYAGFTDWRLPTIEELASLIEARATRGDSGKHLFIDPVFDQYWTCASADRMRSGEGDYALLVGFWYGSFTTHFDIKQSVCAARSLGPGELRSTASPSAK